MCLDILFDKNSIQSKEQPWMTKSFIGKTSDHLAIRTLGSIGL